MLEHLLESIDQHEFETLAEDVKRSLSEHRKWMNKLYEALVLRQPLDDLDFIAEDAHKHCQFGCWIDHLFKDPIFQQGSFLKLDEHHQLLHAQAKALVDQLNLDGSVDKALFKGFQNSQKEFFDTVIQVLEFTATNKHQFDALTKLMNRRSVDTVLAHEMHRMQRAEDSHSCIVLADIDKFKRVNDTYGHDVGDLILQNTASVFHQAIRRHDTVARFGGEEFLFVFPDMTLEDTCLVIERVRQELQETHITHQGESLGITASFGVTQLCLQCDIKTSIKRADTALYYAKENGRNCTVKVNAEEVAKAVRGGEQNTKLIQQFCQKV